MDNNMSLTEEEVVNGFHSLMVSSLSKARYDGLICPGWKDGVKVTDTPTYGPRLCLYYSALRSSRGSPSVVLPYSEFKGGLERLLRSSTCPVRFIHLFHRWAAMVPHIQYLTKENQEDLEALICDKKTINLPASRDLTRQSELDNLLRIAADLRALASEISLCQSFQSRYLEPIRNMPIFTFTATDFQVLQPWDVDPRPGDEPFRHNTMSPQPAQGQIPSPGDNSTSSTQTIQEFDATSETGSSVDKLAAVIGSDMLASEIIKHLGIHGCRNLTNTLDLPSCSDHPFSQGGFGAVYRGRLNDGLQIAIKVMLLRNVNGDQDRSYLKHTARELHTWSKCQHRSVTKLLGLAEFRGRIAMISPWMDNGDLRTYLEKFPSANRCDLSTQMADGLAYLHSIKIIHGDLKGPNVLVSSDGTATLVDFGSAILRDSTLEFTTTSTKNHMSVRWTAPEILTESKLTVEGDVYALGMTILEALTGKVPYSDTIEQAVLFVVMMEKRSPARPEAVVSPESEQGDVLWNLLLSCWRRTPGERPSAVEVYNIVKTITQSGLSYATLAS